MIKRLRSYQKVNDQLFNLKMDLFILEMKDHFTDDDWQEYARLKAQIEKLEREIEHEPAKAE